MTKPIALGAIALVVHAFGVIALQKRIEPFMYNFYVLSWWSYILFLDAVLALKSGTLLIATSRLPYLIVISSAFWCFFELLNLRLKNWFYINIPDQTIIRYFGYLVAFGTVIPGIYVTREAIHRLIGDVPIARLCALKAHLSGWFVSGFISLVLIVLLPSIFFPLAWIFLIPIMDIINYRRGYSSFLGELEQGRAGSLISTILAGLVCGFLWEFWNYWAISKWVYTVPLFEDVKLFEMPVLGYLGFALFAVETMTFFNFFLEARLFKTHTVVVVLFALIFSLGTFVLIERYTVFSHLAKVEELRFISGAKRAQLMNQRVIYSYGIDRSTLSLAETQLLDLLQLKGLGLQHALELRDEGIEGIAGLSSLSPTRMCAIINERETRRCRVYIKAARAAYPGY